MDRDAAARAIEDFLRALGQEPVGEIADTPERVAQAWCEELLQGYSVDPGEVLRQGSFAATAGEAQQLVALRDLRVTTVCPHHLLPAHGDATIIYSPGRRLAGFGVVAKALDALARRLSFQEALGAAVAALLVDEIGARGALCQLRLVHTCLVARGARQSGAAIESVAFAGCMVEAGTEQQAALTLLAGGSAGLPPDDGCGAES